MFEAKNDTERRLLLDAQVVMHDTMQRHRAAFMSNATHKNGPAPMLQPYRIGVDDWETEVDIAAQVVHRIIGKNTKQDGPVTADEVQELDKALMRLAEFTTGHVYCNSVRLWKHYKIATKPDTKCEPDEMVEGEPCQNNPQ